MDLGLSGDLVPLANQLNLHMSLLTFSLSLQCNLGFPQGSNQNRLAPKVTRSQETDKSGVRSLDSKKAENSSAMTFHNYIRSS